MSHYNLYNSLGLNRSQSAESIDYEIEQRINSGFTYNPGGVDELQVARQILGDPTRRAMYDSRLDDPLAPEITVDALRQLAALNVSASKSYSKPSTAVTEVIAEVSAEDVQRYNEFPAQQFPARQAPDTGLSSPAVGTSRAIGSVDKGRNPLPWIIGGVALLLLAGLLIWWLTQRELTEEWTGQNAEIVEAFPELISDVDGGKGFMGMTCRSQPPGGGETAKIRCAGPDNGVSVLKFESVEARDASIPAGERERYGNDKCVIETVALEGQDLPAHFIAPQGEMATYSLLVNGKDADTLRLQLPIC